jgi:cell division protein FtsB
MEDFRRKNKIQRAVYSRSVFFGLLVIAIFFAQGAWGVYQKKQETERNLEELEAKLDDVQRRKDELKTQIDELNSEKGIEREIRNKFSVAKEGEEVVIIVEREKATTATQVDSLSIWQKIKGWITFW